MSLSPIHASSGPLRVLCLGDSITQGGKSGREEYSYRLPLQRIFHEMGIRCDFIGSRSDGLQPDFEWPEVAPGVPFDADHEGYYGHKTADAVRKMQDAWDDPPSVDFALIHLGTNDQKNPPYDETVRKPLEEIIAYLRSANPRVHILIGYLNFNDSPGAFRINAELAELSRDLSTGESPIHTVAHYSDWHEDPSHPQADTFDWAHPNPQGQKKMAEKWYAAMRPYLEK